MPLAVLSPAIGSSGGITIVNVVVPRPIHPGIELNEQGSFVGFRTEDYAQIHGHDFDPFLSTISELFLSIKHDCWPSRDEIVSILMSADSYR